MHNRPRLQPEISEEERQERLKKIGKYCKLSDTLLSMRKGNVLTAEAFGLTQKILEINPEYYTLWNYRRDIALRLLEQNELTKPTLGESEKVLTQMALEKNPKSYCAWYHRRWAAELGCLNMQEELATCTKFLNLDNRNCTLLMFLRSDFFCLSEFAILFQFIVGIIVDTWLPLRKYLHLPSFSTRATRSHKTSPISPRGTIAPS
jgi:hypothetical protein